MSRTLTPIRLGLVGYGKIARDQHLPAIAQDSRFALTAIADPVNDGPVTSFRQLDALLADSAVDAVVLCQPPAFRFAAATQAIAAGKHVFLEKPPGVTPGEVQHLLAAAERKGVSLYTAWHSRMAPGARLLKTLLHDAQIERIDIVWRENVHVWHPGQQWLWTQQGFGVFDPGINALSILTDLLPHQPRVIEAALDIPSNFAAPIAARLHMSTHDGAPIHADFDFRELGHERWEMRIASSAGRFDLVAGGAGLSHDGKPLDLPRNREYADLYAAFADLIERGACNVDVTPLDLIAQSWMVATRAAVAPHEP